MATSYQISSQNLECPCCLSLLTQPKLLECSHTFCRDCLERVLQDRPDQQTIVCPVCRKGTPVPNGDVGQLQTNIPLNSLVDEVKTNNPTCTVCEMTEKQQAVSYCQDCEEFMCNSCDIGHQFSNHVVVAISEVLSGKLSRKRRQECKKHGVKADERWFSTHYILFVLGSVTSIYIILRICSTCGILEHLQTGLQLEKTVIHDEKLIKNINDLRERVRWKKTSLENHIMFVDLQRNEITNILKKLIDDIDKTYMEYMQLLSARREALKRQVKRLSEKFANELQIMEEESRQTISHMTALEEEITKGMKVPLENDALFVHDTLCENLKSLLGRDDPGDQSPNGVTERAHKISFTEHVKVNELFLGELKDYVWDVEADVELPSKDSMNCMTRAPDGKMAVGSSEGGIHLYSPDGELQQTVLNNVTVSNIGFLADGRSVVRETNNKMLVYTSQWEKLDVTFETMSLDEGGFGGLTVDRDDNIYVSYRKPKMIQVFTPQGGEAVREIMSDEYSPWQLFSFQTTGNFIILTNRFNVFYIDGKGKNKKNVHKYMHMRMLAFPAVCRDDSVIVARVQHEWGLVSIDRYTRDLEHVHNIITDFKIQKPARPWYYVQEFESGEIAFCTPDRLYVII